MQRYCIRLVSLSSERRMTAPLASLMDTNVSHETTQPRSKPRVTVRLDLAAHRDLGFASIGICEVLDDIGQFGPDRRKRERGFHDLLDKLFKERLVDWTQTDAHACAQIMEEKRRRGEALDDHVADAFLAAAAATRGLTVVTRNTGEFRNTGVKTFNPWTAT